MEQSPFWEANRFSASQEIHRILHNPKGHYRVNKSLLPLPVMSQLNTVRVPHHTSWRSIFILRSHLCLGVTSGIFLSDIATKNLYAPFLTPQTCYMPRPGHSSRFDHRAKHFSCILCYSYGAYSYIPYINHRTKSIKYLVECFSWLALWRLMTYI